jgi:flagella basal body P-ring formation protein FlgA
MNFRLMLACATASAALCLVTAAAASDADNVTLILSADAVLDHPKVVLADIARVRSSNMQLKQAIEGLSIANAPRISYVERLGRAELTSLIARRLNLPAAQLHWEGADSVKLRTASHLISINELANVALDALRKQFGARYPGLQLRALSLPPDVELPLGSVVLQARPVDPARLHERTAVWVDVLVDGAVYRSAVIAVQASAREPVYVARLAMARGSEATAADFDVREVDVAQLAEAPLPARGPLPAGRLKRALAPGQVLGQAALAGKDGAMRGDRVHLVVATNSVVIDVMAQAQGDAAVGDMLKVKLESNGEIIAARLISHDVVQIDGR